MSWWCSDDIINNNDVLQLCPDLAFHFRRKIGSKCKQKKLTEAEYEEQKCSFMNLLEVTLVQWGNKWNIANTQQLTDESNKE